MSRLRWTLVVLLAVSTLLFGAGVIAERSGTGTHVGSAASHAEEGGHAEAEGQAENERVLGVDVESTPLAVLAVLAGLGLAALAAGRAGRLRSFLLALVVIVLVWAALDIREVVHQLDESRTGVAALALAVAVLHLAAAAVSGRLALSGHADSTRCGALIRAASAGGTGRPSP
jgi:hypothetical protein